MFLISQIRNLTLFRDEIKIHDFQEFNGGGNFRSQLPIKGLLDFTEGKEYGMNTCIVEKIISVRRSAHFARPLSSMNYHSFEV